MGQDTRSYNWTAAFVAFTNNHPLEEISESFGIPLTMLKNKSGSERWAALRDELPLGTHEPGAVRASAVNQNLAPANPFNQGKALTLPAGLPVTVQKKFEALMQNRATNFDQADKLRTYLSKLVEKLLSGEMKMEQIFHHKGTITRTTREISPADLVNIATFARSIHDMTYKALGDTIAQTERGQDSPSGNGGPQLPQIVINLPSAIAQPRQQMKVLQDARRAGIEIIDVPGVEATEVPASGEQLQPQAASEDAGQNEPQSEQPQ